MKTAVLFLIACVSIAGCTTVPLGAPDRDAQLKEFRVSANKSSIYIYRNEFAGGAIRMDILLNGVEIGSTVWRTYLHREVEPGKHTITAKGENRDSIEVDAKPGEIIYIWQEVKIGFTTPRTKLHVVTDQLGKSGVRESQLAVQ